VVRAISTPTEPFVRGPPQQECYVLVGGHMAIIPSSDASPERRRSHDMTIGGEFLFFFCRLSCDVASDDDLKEVKVEALTLRMSRWIELVLDNACM
jgi:hypothetical protein